MFGLLSRASVRQNVPSFISPLFATSFVAQTRGYKKGSIKYRKELAKREAQRMFEAQLRQEGRERAHKRNILRMSRRRNDYQNYLWDLKNRFPESWEKFGPPRSWRPLKEHNLIMHKGHSPSP
mmetsp:Transcript_19043/g.26724  ORF Transcript_19043/g.26724 Transcript_19043/m.26724 type:complete len:123 (-) Transcript_19043:55-423(-)